ncbi:hypothetical protein L1987_64955 [Smallanthus sonchifolius]|uniref:Uncharacterized protein n=1 Tax=Smallanthus sonchifolius TaxID=185202 RepID=A0ACB9BSZ7_9ASTR|nr:hypothetical protein L1987_64955 [Smallanthus sonchifolius]
MPAATGRFRFRVLSYALRSISISYYAAEFVSFALRSSSGNTSAADTSSSFGNFGASTTGNSILNRSESSVSNNSDDEAHQFWRHQLPDDITPDFNDDIAPDFSNLSIADVNGTSRFHAPTGGMLMSTKQHEKKRYPSAANFQQMASKPWDMHGDQLLTDIIDEPPYNGDPGQGYLDDLLTEQQIEAMEVNSLEF